MGFLGESSCFEVTVLIKLVTMLGTLYLCTGNTDSSISLYPTRMDTKLWHHRLGHMSEKGMHILHNIYIYFHILNKLICIYVSIMFMENIRESNFSELENKRIVKG